MEQNLDKLLAAAKTNRKVLKQLKRAALLAECFDTAAELRALETEHFGEQVKASEAAAEFGSNFSVALNMAGVNSSPLTAWLIAETLKVFEAKKGDFSLEDGVELKHKVEELFLD